MKYTYIFYIYVSALISQEMVWYEVTMSMIWHGMACHGCMNVCVVCVCTHWDRLLSVGDVNVSAHYLAMGAPQHFVHVCMWHCGIVAAHTWDIWRSGWIWIHANGPRQNYDRPADRPAIGVNRRLLIMCKYRVWCAYMCCILLVLLVVLLLLLLLLFANIFSVICSAHACVCRGAKYIGAHGRIQFGFG